MNDGNANEAERWLTTAAKLLASGDFHGTRTFAIRARDSAPVLADQILAVTDTLLTAQSNPRDWYGILQLVPLTQSMEVVENQYRKLAILLNPGKHTLSFADQAFRFVSEAWNVLSNPSKKFIYDNELRFLQFGQVSQLNQFGQLNQQHYHQQQQPEVQQPQTQMLFMQPPAAPPPKETQTLFMQAPQKETQTQVTQSLFERSPRSNNNDGNAELEGRGQLGLNNPPPVSTRPAESPWTRQIYQLGLADQSQINQTGSVGSSHISWPEPTRTSQINRPEPIRASQVNQSGTSSSIQFNLTEPTRTGQINHTASPPPPPPPPPTMPIRASQVNQSATSSSSQFNLTEPTRSGQINHTASPPAPPPTTTTAPPITTTTATNTEHSQAEPTGSTRKAISTRPNQANKSEGPSFWTACPYCYVLYEYPKAYLDCTLRCQTKDCRRAFHAVVIPSPPLNGKDTYFCSWGFYPLGFSGNVKNMGGKFHNWSPISPMFTGSNNKNAGKQKKSKESAPRVFYDEHDVYVEISDSESEF